MLKKKATCIHSQVKSVSSSEVAAMIRGVFNHCTEMSAQKSYTDTHGFNLRKEIEWMNVYRIW